MKPEISIITVTMNHLTLLKQMLHSLFITCTPKVSFEVILVDNNSTDGTAAYVRKEFPAIHLIENKQTYGFAQNNNIGAARAQGNYMLILNPDIILLPDAIDILYNYLRENESVGIVAPKLLNPDHSIQCSARNFMNIKLLIYRAFTLGNDNTRNATVQAYLTPELSNEQPAIVDWCLGAALLFRSDFYRELGGFDEHFFLYVEDADICQRCWFAGKSVVYHPQAQMIHMHQRKSAHFSKKTLIHLKSHYYFFRKNRFKIKRHPVK
jgi:GT2 family glycosyltransferase